MGVTADVDIVTRAREMRQAVVGANSAQATPVVQVASGLGFEVVEFTPTDDTKALSGAVEHENKRIFVNATEHPGRKRFTIAHEIGHIVLHRDEGNFVDYRHQIGYAQADQPKEQEANHFAVELLMPRLVFEALWSAYSGNVEAVANALMVSKQAAKYRADELRLA